jgi:LysR family glycine cleavage system transcriptional activator
MHLVTSAFESVSRLVSFTKAAEELCVTQGAVSRQIANLESWLGLKLFSRGRHTIDLTPNGQAYFSTLPRDHKGFPPKEIKS